MIIAQNILYIQIQMYNKSRQSQDLLDERVRTQSSLVDYSQSFATNISKKLVNITLPQVQLKGKQSYKKQPYCTICFRNYTTTFRQHHCRVCSNAVCKDCSKSMINKERACDLCVLKLSNPQEDYKKKEMLETLETLCAFLIYRKQQKMEELEHLKNNENGSHQQYQKQLEKQNKIIDELESQNQKLKKQKQEGQLKLEKIRNENEKIEEEISKLQTNILEDDY